MLGAALALLVTGTAASPARAQADLRWYGTVSVSDSATWAGPGDGSTPESGSGSFTIGFDGQVADSFTPAVGGAPVDVYQFYGGIDLRSYSVDLNGATDTWMDNDYTCTSTSTFGSPSVTDGTLTVNIGATPGASGEGSVSAMAENGAAYYYSFPYSINTPDTPGCEEPSFDYTGAGQGGINWLGSPDAPGMGMGGYVMVQSNRDDMGRVFVKGSFTGQAEAGAAWMFDAYKVLSDDATVTVDLMGLPPGVPPPADQPPPPEEQPKTKDLVRIQLMASKMPPGNGSLTVGGKTCRGGDQACFIEVERGSEVRVVANADTGSQTLGLYGCDRYAGLACIITATGPRAVSAYFGEDPEILPPTLLTPDQKIMLADAGADAADEGAMGCALSALILGTGGAAGLAELEAAGEEALNETFGNCVKGITVTAGLGMALKLDPPDPEWRSVGYPEALPAAKTRRCRLRRGCRQLRQAAKRHRTVTDRQASLIEAAGVAANRYGNAVGAGDATVQHAQRAAFAVLLDLSADLEAARATYGKGLVKALRKLGLRKLVVKLPRKPLKPPRAALDRLVRKKLAVDRADALRLVRGVKPKSRKIDVVKQLRAPADTARARAALAALPAVDLVALTRVLAAQEGVGGQALDEALAGLTGCNEASTSAARGVFAAVKTEPRSMANRAFDELARRAALATCNAG